MVDFDALADEWLHEHVEEHPTLGTLYGLEGYDDRLGDFSGEAFERRAARDGRWIERLTALPDDELSDEERIDRDLLIAHHRGNQVFADFPNWRRNPDTYVGPGLDGVYVLFLHRLRPDADLAEAAAARLRQVPGALAAGRENLDPGMADPVLVRRALGMCRAAVQFARDLVPQEEEDPALRSTLAEAGAVAAEAYQDFAGFLEDLAARAEGSYVIGEARYDGVLRDRELLGHGAAELRRRGQAAYDELAEELSRVSRDHFGSDDWRAVVDRLNADHPPTPEAMQDEYAHWTAEARRFLADHELVSFPEGEECRVVPAPPFRRAIIAVAFYIRPPAFRESRVGHFFVPFPPEGTPEDEVRKRLSDNSRASIPTTSVHEAYPGHHWHLTTMLAGRPLRRVVSSPYFTEGWALYSERMMREQGFFTDPAHEIGHLDARIFRAARIVCDTSLHTGDMSFDEAVAFMSTKASLSEPTATAEVTRYCAWPTQASAYLTGALEIERAREGWLAAGGDLRTFHDRLGGSGAMPTALAERALGTPA
ncbi:MAG TPA: DUF885 domain-containing protein [Acidimicrobiales bacterium]